MAQSNLYFCGFNGFNQFNDLNEVVNSFKEVNTEKIFDCSSKLVQDIQVRSLWNYSAYFSDTLLCISGNIDGKGNLNRQFRLDFSIKDVSCTENHCILLSTLGILYKLSLKTFETTEINPLIIPRSSTEVAVKRTKLSSSLSLEHNDNRQTEEIITHIASGRTLSVAISNKNAVYNIPLKIFSFPSHIKIKKISCGIEHCLILTTNGDVYAFGSASRGQLGIGELDSKEQPVLIEALAGIKIIDIAAGGWHSCAISAFNDLYTFGWNVNGQLGLPMYKSLDQTLKDGSERVERTKLATVFANPMVINLPKCSLNENSDKNPLQESMAEDQFSPVCVYAGLRHTICLTDDQKLIGAGWNKYGQLGSSESECDIDRFRLIRQIPVSKNSRVVCGEWSTIVLS